MAVIALTSAKGAPGVTTTALALTLVWPRPVLLIEADTAGSSSILAGYYAGRLKHDRGLVDLAGAHRAGRLADGLWESALQVTSTDTGATASNRWFLPGLTNPNQAGTMASLWEPIASVLRGLEPSGVDVIIDAGRVGQTGSPLPLLRESDLTLLVSRTDLPAIASTRARATVLRSDLASRGSGEDALWLLLVGEGRPFNRRDVGGRANLPVATTMAWDPGAAEVLSIGERPSSTRAVKKWQGSSFVKSARTAAEEIQAVVTRRRGRLAPGARARGGERAHE